MFNTRLIAAASLNGMKRKWPNITRFTYWGFTNKFSPLVHSEPWAKVEHGKNVYLKVPKILKKRYSLKDGLGIDIEVVPPCHRNFKPVIYY